MNREEISRWLLILQENICKELESLDGTAKFVPDVWERKEGGGGISRVMENGSIWEKGGINHSAVFGAAPDFLFKEGNHSLAAAGNTKAEFFATGLSIVLHPRNPWVPIIHSNIRYFELSDGTRWLGGGIDLTPHYVCKKEAAVFHCELQKVCLRHDPNYYNNFKAQADHYFYLPHRNETRGIGGIFFDRLSGNSDKEFLQILEFWKEVGQVFAPLYARLVQEKRDMAYGEKELAWQRLRRSRYVEFNLLYDKGTRFGLETNGRTESILMSLPPSAEWRYNYTPPDSSKESETIAALKKGINWVDDMLILP